MSSLALLLLFILSLSLRKETAKFLFDKDLDKVKILETIMAASKPRSNTLEENEVQQQKVAHDETIICESSGSALTSKEVVIGTEATTYFQMDSPSSLSTKGQRRQSRLMLGPAQQHVEETVNPNARDTREDMADMDYAQPHRKPPIHN